LERRLLFPRWIPPVDVDVVLCATEILVARFPRATLVRARNMALWMLPLICFNPG
jgi:hypothetical protein